MVVACLLIIPIFSVNGQISLQLVPSDYNGYNVSCFGSTNGAINLTITGGSPPYQILWSTNDTIEDLNNLPAGYYRVEVLDSDSIPLFAESEITLTEPRLITIDDQIHRYPNNYNISVFGACNGTISVTAADGVAPYNWQWADNSTSTSRSALCADKYTVTVTDANGCTVKEIYILTQPDRSDWQISGNAGSDPMIHFIGTTDSIDLVLKSYNQERLRFGADGEIRMNDLAGSGNRILQADSTGKFFASPTTAWWLNGNDLITGSEFLGSKNAMDVRFGANNELVMTLSYLDKNVGIGSSIPGYRLHVAHETNSPDPNGIMLQNTSSSNINSEIKFMDAFDARFSMGIDVAHNNGHNFFIYDNLANNPYGELRFIIDDDGRVGIGTLPPSNWASGGPEYKLYVDDGIVTRDVKVTAGAWPDYVFAPEYKLPSIAEYAEFIKRYKHLPGVPSADQISDDKGYELGSMQVMMLEKIEEQALYIIDLQKQINELKLLISKLNQIK